MLDQRGQLLRTLQAVVGSSGCALFLGACAIANTPQQDLAYARWAKCNSSFPVVLERVDLDAGSRSGSPVGEAKRSCNASPKLAARGHCFQNLWASAHRRVPDVARDAAGGVGGIGPRKPPIIHIC